MTTLFQTTIEKLLSAHTLLENFHSQLNFHVRFDMPPYQRLVIERHGERRQAGGAHGAHEGLFKFARGRPDFPPGTGVRPPMQTGSKMPGRA